jgi:hypothetical protein
VPGSGGLARVGAGNRSLARGALGCSQGVATLTLLDTFGEVGKAARDAAGWHECLDRLTDDLDKGELSFQPGQRWAEVHPRYVEAFGPGASAIGPPSGH